MKTENQGGLEGREEEVRDGGEIKGLVQVK